MIGLSLSFCVADIARGIVDEQAVEKIIAGTRYEDSAQFEQVLAEYADVYWSDLPTARAIARRLEAAGKIEQPRLYGGDYPNLVNGIWLPDDDDQDAAGDAQ